MSHDHHRLYSQLADYLLVAEVVPAQRKGLFSNFSKRELEETVLTDALLYVLLLVEVLYAEDGALGRLVAV